MGVRFLLLVAAGLQACVCGRIALGWEDQDDLVDFDDYDEIQDFDDFQKFLDEDLDEIGEWDNAAYQTADDDDLDDYDELAATGDFQGEVEQEASSPTPPTESLSPTNNPLPSSDSPTYSTLGSESPLPTSPESPEDNSFPPTAEVTTVSEQVLQSEGQEESAAMVVLVMFAGTFLAVFIIYSVLTRGSRKKTQSTTARKPASQEEVSRLLKPRGSL